MAVGPGNSSKGDRGFGGSSNEGKGKGADSKGADTKGDDSKSSTGRRGAATGEQENDQKGGIAGGEGTQNGKQSSESKSETPSTTPGDRRANAVAAMTEQETAPGDPNEAAPDTKPDTKPEQTGFFSGLRSMVTQEFADFKADPVGYMGDLAVAAAPGIVAGLAGPLAGVATAVGSTALSGGTTQESVEAGARQGLSSIGSKIGQAIAGVPGAITLGTLAKSVPSSTPTGKPSETRTSDPSTGRRSKAADAFSDRGGNRGMTAGIGGMNQPGFSLSNFDPTAYASHYQGMQANNPNQGLLFTT